MSEQLEFEFNEKVVPFTLFETLPSPMCLEAASALYHEASTGVVQGFAGVIFGPGGMIGRIATPEISDNPYAIIGALERLKLDLLDMAAQIEEENGI